MVPNATHTIKHQKPSSDDLLLPDSVTAIYTCAVGYEIKNGKDTVLCEYHREATDNMTGRELVTSIWTGHDNFSCVIRSESTTTGICRLSVVLFMK